MLRKKGVSRADIAAELHIGTDDINDFIFWPGDDGSGRPGETKVSAACPSGESENNKFRDHVMSVCPNCGDVHDLGFDPHDLDLGSMAGSTVHGGGRDAAEAATRRRSQAGAERLQRRRRGRRVAFSSKRRVALEQSRHFTCRPGQVNRHGTTR